MPCLAKSSSEWHVIFVWSWTDDSILEAHQREPEQLLGTVLEICLSKTILKAYDESLKNIYTSVNMVVEFHGEVGEIQCIFAP